MTTGDAHTWLLQQMTDRQRVGLLLCSGYAMFGSQCQGEGIIAGAESMMGNCDGDVP